MTGKNLEFLPYILELEMANKLYGPTRHCLSLKMDGTGMSVGLGREQLDYGFDLICDGGYLR